MNYREAVQQISKILGLKKFNTYLLEDGSNEIIVDGALEVEKPVYVITENGQLPLKEGSYVLQDQTQINIDEEGFIKEINYDMLEENQNFAEAVLSDGTVVKSPTFDVGEDVFVIGADGSESPAPDGEHELTLRDEEGNETTFKIIVENGKIVERENVEKEPEAEGGEQVEEALADDLSITDDMEDFKKVMMEKMDLLLEVVKNMVDDQEEMKSKVNKFSKEPAGRPISQSKALVNHIKETKYDAFSRLMSTRRNTFGK